jgi:hypothetical protein
MSPLSEAIQNADLPAILERLFPDCGARAGQRGRVKCVWRGGDDLSGGLFIDRSGRWKLKDFVTNQNLDAFQVLVELGGLSKAQAALELTGVQADPKAKKQTTTATLNRTSYDYAFPEELQGWLWASRMVKQPLWNNSNLESQPGKLCLDLLADWIAESIRDEVGE